MLNRLSLSDLTRLDPAIHPFRKKMDARIKSAHDAGEQRGAARWSIAAWLVGSLARKSHAASHLVSPQFGVKRLWDIWSAN
jgi:hypothetical protein